MSDERVSALRGATYRRDGRVVVRLLAHGPLDSDVLQLAGDAVRVALAADEPGAYELAIDCAAALRRRGLPGDDLLADHLDALAGRGPTPVLRPLAVALDQLSEVLEGDPMQGDGLVDRRTGEVWQSEQLEYAVELGEELADAEDDADRWVRVECEGSRDGYRDMVDFLATAVDPSRAELLAVAIEGRGAFRRFRHVLDRWPDLVGPWQAFSAERRIGRARAWLAHAGYRPADAG